MQYKTPVQFGWVNDWASIGKPSTTISKMDSRVLLWTDWAWRIQAKHLQATPQQCIVSKHKRYDKVCSLQSLLYLMFLSNMSDVSAVCHLIRQLVSGGLACQVCPEFLWVEKIKSWQQFTSRQSIDNAVNTKRACSFFLIFIVVLQGLRFTSNKQARNTYMGYLNSKEQL